MIVPTAAPFAPGARSEARDETVSTVPSESSPESAGLLPGGAAYLTAVAVGSAGHSGDSGAAGEADRTGAGDAFPFGTAGSFAGAVPRAVPAQPSDAVIIDAIRIEVGFISGSTTATHVRSCRFRATPLRTLTPSQLDGGHPAQAGLLICDAVA